MASTINYNTWGKLNYEVAQNAVNAVVKALAGVNPISLGQIKELSKGTPVLYLTQKTQEPRYGVLAGILNNVTPVDNGFEVLCNILAILEFVPTLFNGHGKEVSSIGELVGKISAETKPPMLEDALIDYLNNKRPESERTICVPGDEEIGYFGTFSNGDVLSLIKNYADKANEPPDVKEGVKFGISRLPGGGITLDSGYRPSRIRVRLPEKFDGKMRIVKL